MKLGTLTLLILLFFSCSNLDDVCFYELNEVNQGIYKIADADSDRTCYSFQKLYKPLSKFYSKIDTIKGTFIQNDLDVTKSNHFKLVCLYLVNDGKPFFLISSFNQSLNVCIDTFSFNSFNTYNQEIQVDSLGRTSIEIKEQEYTQGIESNYKQIIEISNKGEFSVGKKQLESAFKYNNKLSGRYYFNKDSTIVYLEITDSEISNLYDYKFSIKSPKKCVSTWENKDQNYLNDTILNLDEGIYVEIYKDEVKVNLDWFNEYCHEKLILSTTLIKDR